MFSHFLKATAASLIAFSLFSSPALAEEETSVDKDAETIEKAGGKDEVWAEQLKTRYNLTEEQIKTLRSTGLSNPQLAMAAQMAKSSNKSIEDVLKMRTEQKMGWGKIAKELNVHPSEIGKSVKEMHHAIRDERKEMREQRKDERKAAREERKEKMAQKREERKEKHNHNHKGH